MLVYLLLILSGLDQPLDYHQLFSWFPAGDYSQLAYDNLEALESTELFQMSESFSQEISSLNGVLQHPQILSDISRFRVRATLLRLDDATRYIRKRDIHDKQRTEQRWEKLTGHKPKLMRGEPARISVYELIDPVAGMEELKRQKVLEEVEQLGLGQRLFAVNFKPEFETNQRLYAVFKDGELAVSVSREALLASLQTKLFLRPGLVDFFQEFIQYQEYFPKHCHRFRINFGHARARVKYDVKVRDATPERQEELDKYLEFQYSTASIIDLWQVELGDPAVGYGLKIYSNSEVAKEMHDYFHEKRTEGAWAEYERVSRTDPNYVKLEENVVRSKVVYNEEWLSITKSIGEETVKKIRGMQVRVTENEK